MADTRAVWAFIPVGHFRVHPKSHRSQLCSSAPSVGRCSKEPSRAIRYPLVAELFEAVLNVVIPKFGATARTDVVVLRRVRHLGKKTNWANEAHLMLVGPRTVIREQLNRAAMPCDGIGMRNIKRCDNWTGNLRRAKMNRREIHSVFHSSVGP